MSISQSPLLSIVIATFNAEGCVGLAIESILKQSFKDFEIIIVDGLSTDGTLAVVRGFASDQIVLVSERDRGIYDAWNKGINLANGKWLLFIGADDQLGAADCLQKFVDTCEAGQLFDGNSILYGNLIVQGSDGEPMDRLGGAWENPWGFRCRYMTSAFPIPIMASFFKRKSVIAHGGFSLDYKIISDIELVIRISKNEPALYVPDHVLTVMGYGGVSTNPLRALILLRESFMVRRKHSLGTLTNLGFLNLAFRQIIKYAVAKYFGSKLSGYLISTYQKMKKNRLHSLPYDGKNG